MASGGHYHRKQKSETHVGKDYLSKKSLGLILMCYFVHNAHTLISINKLMNVYEADPTYVGGYALYVGLTTTFNPLFLVPLLEISRKCPQYPSIIAELGCQQTEKQT